MSLSSVQLIGLVFLLGVAGVSDLSRRRIPNRLTLPAFLLGVVAAGAADGWGGAGDALLGGFAGFGLFFFLYLFGSMGAGDVKLVAAAGTFLGFPLVLWGALCSAVAGGMLALGVALHQRALVRVVGNAGGLLLFWLNTRGLRPAAWLAADRPDAVRIPYGVAIGVGCAFAAFRPWLSVF